jgi:class 3 adenylate cyclase
MALPTSPNPYPEERRIASVLFADVQGFTTLAERVDFEAASDLIKGLWQRLDEIILTHGGYIDKHQGDGVMAVWGAPYAVENDAEQAVAAAMELQAAFQEYIRSSSRKGADELKMRIGINTGPVLAGYVGVKIEYTVMGDTVNVANRLEQAAEPNTVTIGESTARLVRGVFHLRRLEPFFVRGRAEIISAYQVEASLPQPTRVAYHPVESLETHMVEREIQMARLAVLFHQAMHNDRALLTIVSGDAGLGKSRLLLEFASQISAENPSVVVFSARALSQASQVPFYFWRSLWRNRFGVNEDDSLPVVRAKFLLGVRAYWGEEPEEISAEEVTHFIASLAGIVWEDSPYLKIYKDDPIGRVQRSFELTLRLLRRVSSHHQTLILLDDLQWADSSSLDLFIKILDAQSSPGKVTEPMPLLILAGSRPDFLRRNPRWANLGSVMELTPLPRSSSVVSKAYPDLAKVPVEILSELAQRSEGNPYFLEEMVKGLLKSKLAEKAVSPEDFLRLIRTYIPESLRVMLQARLDSLSREARSVALLASVVGRVFWVGAVLMEARANQGLGTGPLTSLPGEVIERVVQDALRQLVQAELAFPRPNSRFSGDQEYIFKHSLLREVAYSLIPNKTRSRVHLAVASWLSDHPDPDLRVMAAEHYEQGGAILEATHFYEEAARYARSRGAAHESAVLLARARTLRSRQE